MPELCAYCGELIDVEHQLHIVIYSDVCTRPTEIIGFVHMKCKDELTATKNYRQREALKQE